MGVSDLKTKEGILKLASGALFVLSCLLTAAAIGNPFYSAGIEADGQYLAGFEDFLTKHCVLAGEEALCDAYTKDYRDAACLLHEGRCSYLRSCQANLAMIAIALSVFVIGGSLIILSLFFFEKIFHLAGLICGGLGIGLSIVGVAVFKAAETYSDLSKYDPENPVEGYDYHNGVASGFNCQVTGIVFAFLALGAGIVPIFIS